MGERGNIVAFVVLVLIALLLVGVWLFFPYVVHFMQNQDCIAAGHMNC